MLKLCLHLGLGCCDKGIRGCCTSKSGTLALDLAASERCEDDDVDSKTESNKGVEKTPEIRRGAAAHGGRRYEGRLARYCARHTRERGHGARRKAGAGHELGHHLHHGILVSATGRRTSGAAGIAAVEAKHHLPQLVLRDSGFRDFRCIWSAWSAVGDATEADAAGTGAGEGASVAVVDAITGSGSIPND
ncbi:hypothetical protein HG530_015692 [Fusarium avenaceum]|nr:hypothetical protein HG530_015692 [Fusarium avenaceum]